MATNEAARPLHCLTKDTAMTELKETFHRNAATIGQDFAGAAALVVIAFVGLSLPSFF